MIVISANNLSRSYGTDEIFSGVSFHVNKGDRIGLVGANGAGKSTLLNVIAGELPYDEGSYFISGDLKLGYFRQNDLFSSENTVYDEMLAIFSDVIQIEKDMSALSERIAELSGSSMEETPFTKAQETDAGSHSGSVGVGGHDGQLKDDCDTDRLLREYDRLLEEFNRRGGYSYKSEIEGVLNSMAFPPSFFDKKTSSLSGGEKTRLALASLLLKRPDILLLDEPTNHLDIGTLKWLEQYIRAYSGSVIIISHDRYFLDHTVNRIFEMENHRLTAYEGNYSFYAEEKKIRMINELKAYEHHRMEIRRQEDMIRRMKERGTEKLAKRARSREKRLSKMEMKEKPVMYNARMRIQFKETAKSGNDTLSAVDISKAFGSGSERRTLFSNVSFDIKRGERICIIGANGAGKTTLLKMIMSETEPSGGHIKVGHNIVFGYYDQEQSMLNESSTVIEEMRDAYSLYSDTELRGLLGRFLFKNDDVFKTVDSLSGGERARLSLLKLMLSGANMLILDEPTNHLDIISREVFEDALIDFPGTSIIVSHDRYLLNRVPTSIYELTRDGITVFPGNYDYYNEKKNSITSANAYMNSLGRDASATAVDAAANASAGSRKRAGLNASGAEPAKPSSAAEERRRNKEVQAEKRRQERRIAALEERITKLEGEISDIEHEMYKEEYMTDHTKLAEFSGILAGKKAELDWTYEEWSEATSY